MIVGRPAISIAPPFADQRIRRCLLLGQRTVFFLHRLDAELQLVLDPLKRCGRNGEVRMRCGNFHFDLGLEERIDRGLREFHRQLRVFVLVAWNEHFRENGSEPLKFFYRARSLVSTTVAFRVSPGPIDRWIYAFETIVPLSPSTT